MTDCQIIKPDGLPMTSEEFHERMKPEAEVNPIAMNCRREGELFFLEVTVQGHTIGVDLKIPESDLSLPAAALAKRYVAPSLHAISAAFARMESWPRSPKLQEPK